MTVGSPVSQPGSANGGNGERPLGRGARLSVRILAGLGLLTFCFMLTFVIIDAVSPAANEDSLVAPGSEEARIGAEHPGEAVHITGTIAAIVIGVAGLGTLAVSPNSVGAAWLALAASISMLTAIVITGNADNQGGQAGLFDPAFLVMAIPPTLAALVARPWRGRHRSDRRRSHTVLAVLGLPGVLYAVDQALMQRNTWPPKADPHHQAHWYAMGLAAFLIVLAVVASALPSRRGWATAAMTGGLGAIAVGGVSLVRNDAGSALPIWAAALAIAWGVAVVGITFAKSRRAARGLQGDRQTELSA